MKKGFTIIEILIAMMVLFVSIAFVNISMKAFNNYQKKSNNYQNFYITALSLKDWISEQSFNQNEYVGKLNGIKYVIKIKALIHRKNYRFDPEQPEESGNYGKFLITLYKLNMTLSEGSMIQDYSFILTKQKLLNSFLTQRDGQ